VPLRRPRHTAVTSLRGLQHPAAWRLPAEDKAGMPAMLCGQKLDDRWFVAMAAGASDERSVCHSSVSVESMPESLKRSISNQFSRTLTKRGTSDAPIEHCYEAARGPCTDALDPLHASPSTMRVTGPPFT